MPTAVPIVSRTPPCAAPVLMPAPAPGCPIHVAAAPVANHRHDDPARRFASGWGATPAEAIAGCEAEMAERLSGQIAPPGASIAEAARSGRERVVRPGDILLDEVAHPGPTQWLPCLGHNQAVVLVPARLAVLGHPADEGSIPAATTPGLACGSDIGDAVVRAFLELVERDAVALWWYCRAARPRLVPADIGDVLLGDVARWTADRGRSLVLNDLTTDFGIPVVAAFSHGAEGGAPALGFGAGRSAGEAARHAVGELCQFEANLALIEIQTRRRGQGWLTPEARALRDWPATHGLARMRHAGGAAYGDPPPPRPLDVETCRALCEERGLELLTLDMSRQEIGRPVARVFVPGLRSAAPHFAPGRLFDVPVALGWRDGPIQRHDLCREAPPF